MSPTRLIARKPRQVHAARLWSLSLALAIVLAALPALAKDWPRPAGHLGDYANVVGAPFQQKINEAGKILRLKTGAAIIVATLPSLDNETIEEACSRLYRAWGIGEKGVDKGALILVAVAQRKVRIEVGYGLEGSLTDARSAQIRDQVIVPHLREGRYGQGLYDGLLAIGQVAAAQAKVEIGELPQVIVPQAQGKHAPRQESPYGSWSLWGAIFLVLVIYIFAKAARGAGRDGGGWGGFLSGMLLGSLLSGGRRGDDGSGGSSDSDSDSFGGGDSGGGGASGDY